MSEGEEGNDAGGEQERRGHEPRDILSPQLVHGSRKARVSQEGEQRSQLQLAGERLRLGQFTPGRSTASCDCPRPP
jgi:hypothetical protein